jgi:hypothetical protein
MNGSQILAHIEALVSEEHALLAKAEAQTIDDADRHRLAAVQVELDRYYDLLRQRRARQEFGEDPDAARLRPADVVEKYLQ